MTERFTFADSEPGLVHAFNTALSLRRAGFRTRLVPEVMGHTTVLVIHATPNPRPNRKARGCSGR